MNLCFSSSLAVGLCVREDTFTGDSVVNDTHQDTRSARNTYESGIFVEARLHKLFEGFAVGALQRRGRVFRDVEEHTHGVQVRVRRLSLSQLDGGDAQRPDISLDTRGGVGGGV